MVSLCGFWWPMSTIPRLWDCSIDVYISILNVLLMTHEFTPQVEPNYTTTAIEGDSVLQSRTGIGCDVGLSTVEH